MKIILHIILFLASLIVFAQLPKHKVCYRKLLLNEKRYSVDSVTSLFNDFANSYIEKDFDSAHYSNKSVWIIDLVDTLNTSHNRDFYFSENHIYVFSPVRVRYVAYDYHNIAVIANGDIRFFKAINCQQIGDSLIGVIQYIKETISIRDDLEEILNRVRSCTKNGFSSIMRKMWPDDHDLIYDKFECKNTE